MLRQGLQHGVCLLYTSGKTTILRIVGGFETPDSGRVIFSGKDITDVPPNKREINTVFQKYALFPHMNIQDNIAFGLKISGKTCLLYTSKISRKR